MADLSMAIRELAEPALAENAPLFADAILAVLGLHTPDKHGDCIECTVQYEEHHEHPCQTVRAMAKALGLSPGDN